MIRILTLRRIACCLALLALAAAGARADAPAFKRGLARLKETLLLAAPAYNKVRHEPVVKAFLADLVGALEDASLEPVEAAHVAESYAAALDTLKIRRRRGPDEDLRALLAGIPVPEPKVDGFFKETEACLARIRRVRERSTTPEGLLKHYGDGAHVDRVTELFERERAGGYATKAGSGEIKEMLARYYPDRARGGAGTEEAALARTSETILADPKLVDDLFK